MITLKLLIKTSFFNKIYDFMCFTAEYCHDSSSDGTEKVSAKAKTETATSISYDLHQICELDAATYFENCHCACSATDLFSANSFVYAS